MIHVFFKVSSTQSAIPVIGNVTAVHDFAEQVAQVFPGHLRVRLEVVVQYVDTDGEVAGVERVLAVPALRTELASLGHHSVEVAQREQNALELHLTSAHLQRILKIRDICKLSQYTNIFQS